MGVVALGIAALLIWGGFIYFTRRRLAYTGSKGIEDGLNFELQAAAWSDRHVETLLARHPGSPVLLTQYVENAISRDDWPEALRRVDLFTSRAPRQPKSWLARARVLRRMGRAEESACVLREALRLHGRNADILLAWAREAVERRDWAEANTRFARLRRRFPLRGEGYFETAFALVRAGQPEAAEALIAEGQRRLPKEVQMWYAAAETAERMDNLPEAIRRWEAMRHRFPTQAGGFLRGAAALKKSGDEAAATALLRQARDFFPANKEIAAAAAQLPPPPAEV